MTEAQGSNFIFSKGTRLTTPARNQVVQSINSGELIEWNQDGLVRKEVREGYRRKELNRDETELVHIALEHAAEKLKLIGVNEPEKLLPRPSQVYFIVRPSNLPYERPSGGAPEFGNGIRIVLSEEEFLDAEFVQKIFFHELSHFISLRIIHSYLQKADPDDPDEEAMLISRVLGVGFSARTNMTGTYRSNIFEEPLADYFAVFCLEGFDNLKRGEVLNVEIAYVEQTAFFFAFIINLAARTGEDPLSIFKIIFKAKISRDFSVFKDIIQVYGDKGTDFTKALLRVETYLFGEKDEGGNKVSVKVSALAKVAQLGGFETDFIKILARFQAGEEVQCPGLNHSMKMLVA